MSAWIISLERSLSTRKKDIREIVNSLPFFCLFLSRFFSAFIPLEFDLNKRGERYNNPSTSHCATTALTGRKQLQFNLNNCKRNGEGERWNRTRDIVEV